MIKSLKRNDIRYTPFAANKFWNAQNQRFEDLISWQSGSESGSLSLTFFDYGDGTRMSEISSAFSSAIAYQQQDADFLKFKIGKEITGSTFYPAGDKSYNSDINPVNIDESYQSLVYNSKKNLYYNESENPTQIFGLESLDPSNVNRTIPKQISVFTVPLNKMGEKIQPTSVEIKHDLPIGYTTIIDDGNNNLKISGSAFSDVQNASYNCVSASVTHGNLTQTYNGFQISASVSTIPSNLSVSTVYNGSSVAPTSAGTYTVFSEISDGYYCGTKTDLFKINKSQASLTVTSVTNVYDGIRHDVSVSTIPSGLNYDVVYRKDGLSETDPINVGTYLATVTINDQNYFGTSTGTSTITAPASNISFNPINNVNYGDIWEIVPVAVDTVNGFPIEFSVTAGSTLANRIGVGLNQKISLTPSKTATSLGTVTITATTVPNISGFTSTSTTRTFTINVRNLNITGVSADGQPVGSGTTVNINNTNINLSGIVVGDDVSISSYPTTGTIPTDNIGNYPVTLGINYIISGTHNAKYSLTQPSLTVGIYNQKIVTNFDLKFTYDTFERSVIDILTSNSLKSIENLIVDYYYNNQRIGGEKYTNGILKSRDGELPKNVGTYTVKLTNDLIIGVDEIKTVTVEIKKAIATLTLTNLTQGGIKTIKSSEKSTKIKPLNDEISTVNVTNISITDRNSKPIYLNDLINQTSILYNSSPLKPSTVGNYNINAQLNSLNVAAVNNTTPLIINDFVYVVTDDLSKTSNENIILSTQASSSVYNLRKYVDPSVTSSWSSVITSHPSLTNYKLIDGNINFEIVGGGGAGYIEESLLPIKQVDLQIDWQSAVNNIILFITGDQTTTSQYKTLAEILVRATDNAKSLLSTLTSYTQKFNYLNKVYTLYWNGISTNNGLIVTTSIGWIGTVRIIDETTKDEADFDYNFSSIIGLYNIKINQVAGNINSIKSDPAGSGASVKFTLPSQYIINKNLQTFKAIIGKSGIASRPATSKSSYIEGIVTYDPGQSEKIATGTITFKNYSVTFPDLRTVEKQIVVPILKNFKPTHCSSPTEDLVFIGRSVTQEQLTNYGIQTPIDSLVRITAGDKLKFKFNVWINHYLSLGYQIWDVSQQPSQNYTDYINTYTEVYNSGKIGFSDDRNKIPVTDEWEDHNFEEKEFTVSPNFTDKSILVISFADFIYTQPTIHGLHYLNVDVIPITIATDFRGGNSYFVTSSSTSFTGSQYAFLGMIAGGGDLNNYGTSSVNFTQYKGQMYNSNVDFSNEINSSVNSNNNYTNQSLNYNIATNGTPQGNPVDSLNNYGAGGVRGYRGNFIIRGESLLSEIYVNSSSVYNINQVS